MDDSFVIGALDLDAVGEPIAMGLGIGMLYRCGRDLVTAACQALQVLLQAGELLRWHRNQHEHGKLTAQPGHPTGFHVAAALKHHPRDFFNETDPIAPGQRQHVCLLHGEPSCPGDCKPIRQSS